MKPWEQWAKITGAHTTEADIKGTNPLFSSGREYQINCQRCVPAYEMRRRGYDVTALPRIMTGVDDTANHWQSIFENAQWLACSSGSGVTQVTNQLKAWGDGARAEILCCVEGPGRWCSCVRGGKLRRHYPLFRPPVWSAGCFPLFQARKDRQHTHLPD